MRWPVSVTAPTSPTPRAVTIRMVNFNVNAIHLAAQIATAPARLCAGSKSVRDAAWRRPNCGCGTVYHTDARASIATAMRLVTARCAPTAGQLSAASGYGQGNPQGARRNKAATAGERAATRTRPPATVCPQTPPAAAGAPRAAKPAPNRLCAPAHQRRFSSHRGPARTVSQAALSRAFARAASAPNPSVPDRRGAQSGANLPARAGYSAAAALSSTALARAHTASSAAYSASSIAANAKSMASSA
jgi:hypothetical protein